MTRTRIEWATDTWNPVTGCTKVSEGCRHCYAERQVQRFGTRVHGLHRLPEFKADVDRICTPPKFTHVICHHDKLDQPSHWCKPRRVFVCSMSDLFHAAVSDDFLHAVFDVMSRAIQHDFLVLTKRPDRMRDFVVASNRPLGGEGGWRFGGPFPLPNVWLGVSVENQATADERIPHLLQTPAAVRFVSCEPMLGPINLDSALAPQQLYRGLDAVCGHLLGKVVGPTRHPNSLDWVICGGESGPGARPMHPAWARALRDQCAAAGVPFFFKQWGEWQVASQANGHIGGNMPDEGSRYTWLGIDGRTQNPSSRGLGDDAYAMARVGKKRAGRWLDGKVWDQVPEVTG